MPDMPAILEKEPPVWRSKEVSIRVTQDEFDRLYEYAKEDGRSMSDATRRLAMARLDQLAPVAEGRES